MTEFGKLFMSFPPTIAIIGAATLGATNDLANLQLGGSKIN